MILYKVQLRKEENKNKSEKENKKEKKKENKKSAKESTNNSEETSKEEVEAIMTAPPPKNKKKLTQAFNIIAADLAIHKKRETELMAKLKKSEAERIEIQEDFDALNEDFQ